MSFTHLHLHSEYSLLDGLPKIKELAPTAKKLGFNSLAITDHGTMFGAVEFYQACLKEEIKPHSWPRSLRFQKRSHHQRKKLGQI